MVYIYICCLNFSDVHLYWSCVVPILRNINLIPDKCFVAFTLKTYPECFLDKIPHDSFPLQVGGEVLSQVEGFKYFGVLLMSEGKMKCEIYRG